MEILDDVIKRLVDLLLLFIVLSTLTFISKVTKKEQIVSLSFHLKRKKKINAEVLFPAKQGHVPKAMDRFSF